LNFMYKKLRWYTILTISIITTGVLVAGLSISLALTTSSTNTTKQDIQNVPTPGTGVSSPNPSNTNTNANNNATNSVVNSKDFNILVLGDSLAKGTGDETSKGFAGYFADYYKTKTVKPVVLNNLAVNGDVSNGLLKIIETTEAKAYLKGSNIILLSIGGNEISRFKTADLSLASDKIKSIQDNYTTNIKQILKLIRKINNACTIVFVGLYNPFGKEITPDKITFVNSWNYNTEQLVSLDPNSLFIPTYDLFKNNLSTYLTADNFHPNSKGYKAIANRIATAIGND
jgi:lysophospholipase L1-like esterase